MEVAALGLSVDSGPVEKASAALNEFSASSTKAEKTVDKAGGSISKIVALMQSMDGRLGTLVSGIETVNSSLLGMATRSEVAASAQNSLAASEGNAAVAAQKTAQTVNDAAQKVEVLGRAATSTASAVGAAASDLNQFSAATGGMAASASNTANAAIRLAPAVSRAGTALNGVTGSANTTTAALNHTSAAMNDLNSEVAVSAGAMKANTGNIAAQFQDIGVTAAMGMNPLMIALQQGTQLSAVFAQTGGSALASLGAAFKQVVSPQALLTIGLVAGAAALLQWATNALAAGDSADKLQKALDGVRLTTSAVGDVQSALGNVFDLTTGKAINQTDAMYGLARAQLELVRVQAMADQAAARSTLSKASQANDSFSILNALTVGTMPDRAGERFGQQARSADIVKAFMGGRQTAADAIDALSKLEKQGKMTTEAFLSASTAIASYGVANENIKVAERGVDALGGDRGALAGFVDPARSRAASSSRTGRQEKSEAEKQAESWAKLAESITQQARGLQQAGAQIGVYGEQLDRLRIEQDFFNKAQDDGIRLTDAMAQHLRDSASAMAQLAQANRTAQFMEDFSRATKTTAENLERQRGELFLTGAALQAFRIETEALNQAKAAGIELNDAQLKQIRDEAAARAELSVAVAKQQEDWDRIGKQAEAQVKANVAQIEEQNQAAREVVGGFLKEWFDGVRNGENIFKSFTRSVLDGLNRIVDRLLDKTISGFLDGFLGQTGGFLGSLLGGGGGGAMKFAKGGAFTNTIVDTPTLFRFANGGAFGEMGEAGPEAIMPLKRGSDGSLGVQVHGGAGASGGNTVNVSNNITVSGAVSSQDIMALVQQASMQTQQEVKRNLTSWLGEYNANGAVV